VILKSEKAGLSGEARMPASKSHTIRALAFASLAHGASEIADPLNSADTLACVNACRGLGAEIDTSGNPWTVVGTASRPAASPDVIDVMNSGTTLYIALGMAALCDGENTLTGDDQTRRRPAQPLLDALNALGARAESIPGNGCAPIRVRGPLKGGAAAVACPTSQYLTSLLIAAPLAPRDTRIEVTLLNEAPYVRMTLDWLDLLGIKYAEQEMRIFEINGGQLYPPFSQSIKGDFSSATFFLCAAAVTGGDITLLGLDMSDSQGDKAVVHMLERMGAKVDLFPGAIRIRGAALSGADLDLNATPDALPALAVTGCFARGTTRLLNVPQARLKETDRIRVMREVITALGGEARELPGGLVVQGGGLKGGRAHGHGDHRVVMACALAGLAAETPVEVDTAEAVSVTFPDFVQLMNQTGARMTLRPD